MIPFECSCDERRRSSSWRTQPAFECAQPSISLRAPPSILHRAYPQPSIAHLSATPPRSLCRVGRGRRAYNMHMWEGAATRRGAGRRIDGLFRHPSYPLHERLSDSVRVIDMNDNDIHIERCRTLVSWSHMCSAMSAGFASAWLAAATRTRSLLSRSVCPACHPP